MTKLQGNDQNFWIIPRMSAEIDSAYFNDDKVELTSTEEVYVIVRDHVYLNQPRKSRILNLLCEINASIHIVNIDLEQSFNHYKGLQVKLPELVRSSCRSSDEHVMRHLIWVSIVCVCAMILNICTERNYTNLTLLNFIAY